MQKSPPIDFSETRPLWLSIDVSAEDTNMQIECLNFLGGYGNLITNFKLLELLRTIKQELVLAFGVLEVTPLKLKLQYLLL